MSGVWEVRTETGSAYVLDLQEQTLTRLPDRDNEVYSDLRRDGDSIPILAIITPPCVGFSMTLLINIRGDGVPTLRTTSLVVSIKELERNT